MPTKPHSQLSEGVGAETIRRNDECFAMTGRVARLDDCQPGRWHRTPDQRCAPPSDHARELQTTVTAADQFIDVSGMACAQALQLRTAGQSDSAEHQRQWYATQRDDRAAERQHMHKRYGRAERGRSFQGEIQIAGQSRLKISVPLVPPKPKEFDSAARIGISRAVSGA